MARVVKPPESLESHDLRRSIFLAGSIDQGVAPDWQSQVCDAFASSDVVLLNPRRDEWDATWEQSITNELVLMKKLCAQHAWPVIDVTRRSIEETAAAILNLLAERQAKTDAAQ